MSRPTSWVHSIADRMERRVDTADPPRDVIVCASGVSPSGPIHLGNLREVMTVHLVAEELRRRGRRVQHLHSWDDFDRLRKVPEGLPEGFGEHVGRPLVDVPDPGGEFESYADRHIHEFTAALDAIGVSLRPIRQAAAYRSGTYREPIKIAMARRLEIFDILAEHQTADRHEKPLEERRQEFYPFRVYCHDCGRDDTRVTAYDQATATVTYACDRGHGRSFSLDQEVRGKLVWKVDWPMRWRFEGVDFEPAGADHSAPGSSREVGVKIQRAVFGGEPPYYAGYAFVGITGQSKISSSAGTEATPAAALEILSPAILRWLYTRRQPRQSFSIDFGQETLRLYDEWDGLRSRVEAGKASELHEWIYRACVETSTGPVRQEELPVSFRLLSSAADLTQGNLKQVLRIVSEHLDNPPPTDELRRKLEPRLTCAINWMTRHVPDEERTQVRPAFDWDAWQALDPEQRADVERLAQGLDDHWGLDGLTRWVYGVPKLGLGYDVDEPPNDAIKKAQRRLFVAVYSLLVGAERGPRLPTLLVSIGKERARALLTPPTPVA